MERMNRLVRLMLLAMVAIVAPLGTTAGIASAQGTPTSGDSYISELSDLEVEVVSDDFTISDTELQEYQHGEGENVFIEGDISQIQVSFFDDTDDPETTVSLFNDGVAASADSFEVVDEGVDGDVAWSLADVTIEGVDIYYYNRVTPDVVGNVDVMEALMAPQEDFLDDVELVQDGILIDGDPMFDDVDVDDLEEISTGGATTPEVDTDVTEEDATAIPEEDDLDTDATGGAEEVYVSEVSGIEVEYAEPFVEGDSQVYGSGDTSEESVTFHGDLSNVTLGFFIGDDAEQSLDEFLGGFDGSAESREEIASGYEDGVAWTFSEAVLGDGTEALMYIQIREDVSSDFLVLEGLIGDVDAFYDEFDAAQEVFLIDGDELWPGVTSTDLEDLSTGSGDGMTTPEADEEEDEDVSGTEAEGIDESDEANSRRDRARLPGNDETGNETETGGTAEPETGTGFEDAGLVAEGEYVSPQYDTEVVWDDTWYIDMEDEESVMSDAAAGMDSLFLIWDGSDFAMLFIDISTADGLAPADFVDYWVSDDYMAENADPDAEILLDDSTRDGGAVIMTDYLDGGDEIVIAKEAIALDDGETIAVVTLIGFPDSFADTYDDAEADIEIADGSAFNVFRSRDVEDAVGN